jgi:hypothetical protein
MSESPESQEPRKQFHHVGLRAMDPMPVEFYIPPSKCWISGNPVDHPHRIEYLRYAPDSPITEEFQNAPHIAYEVDDLEPHLEGKDIYLQPFEVGDPPFATVAFTKENGLFIEYMKFRPGRKWHDE